MVTVRPITIHSITFHPKRFPQFLVKYHFPQFTFHPIHTFHPNYVSPKLCFTQTTLVKEFHLFFSSKTYIADELWFPIITPKPLDRFTSNFDWEKQENCGNVFRLVKKNLIWLGRLIYTNTLMQIVVNPQLFCSKSAKPHFIWPWRHSYMYLSTSPQKGGSPFL